MTEAHRHEARGKPVRFLLHALEGAYAEGFHEGHILKVLDAPTYDDGMNCYGRAKGRYLIVRYRNRETYILVHGTSATTRKPASL